MWREIASGIDATAPRYQIESTFVLPGDVSPGHYDVRVRGNGLVLVIPYGLDVAA